MVSVVMPAWNEAEIIEDCVREWYDEVVSKIAAAELIVVDDCSTDSTGVIVSNVGKALPGVRCVRPERNGGHGKALRTGFDHATQPFVFQTDSDRQHKPADFWKCWELRERADFVFGIRKQRADGAVRIVITRGMRILNLAIWGVWVRDANCPFKLMRREALAKVLEQIPRDCFIPMVLVSILARKMRFRIAEAEVEHLPRKGGTQSLKGLVKWARVGSRCARQILSIRLSYNA
ncbi:MAG TPA: glycosyltransferase family 2 protein [Bryobacteraceae bacterium]|jgi:glycosyltransferase involved in cell wall biosynthesis